jgi:hypothetical protein
MQPWLRITFLSAIIIILLPLIYLLFVPKDTQPSLIFAVIVAVLIAAFASVILAKIVTNEINIRYLISEDNGNASLSRFQFLLLTFVIGASYFLMVTWVVANKQPDLTNLALPNIPPNVLGLIGISGASYVVAKGIQKSTVEGSRVVRVHVTQGGVGYTQTPTITFIGGGGTDAQATATLVGNVVDHIDVMNPGTGYTSTPTVQISGGGGTGAAAVAELG